MDNPSAYIRCNCILRESFNECSRRKDTPLWMPPTQKRLGTDNRSVSKPNLRLKIQLKFVVRVSPRQLEIQSTSRLSLCTKHGQEKTRRAASAGFRLIKRKVGIGNQFINARAIIGRDGDACAAAKVDGVIIDLKALRKPIQYRVDDRTDHARITAFRNNYNKFIATEPKHMNRLAAGFGGLEKTLSNLDKQLVANGVTEGVIDVFEAIEVEQRNGYRPIATIASEQSAQLLLQRQSIGKPSER